MFRTLIDIRSYQDQYDQKLPSQQDETAKTLGTGSSGIASVDGQNVSVIISNTQVKSAHQQVEVEDEKFIIAALQRAEVYHRATLLHNLQLIILLLNN